MKLEQLTIIRGKRTIFENFTLDLERGSITCMMGPSGIGKTTLLRVLAGLEKPQRGKVSHLEQIKVGCVFQEPRLLPTRTALENVMWVGENLLQEEQQARRLLETAGLADWVHAYPSQLSGGMRQRVSLVRAFFARSEFLLLDEPFQGLDMATKTDMQRLLWQLWSEFRPTILLVTHEIEEAVQLGSRIIMLEGNPAKVQTDVMVQDKNKIVHLLRERIENARIQ
ncbi:ABC transporter ATP-binding protein [Bacillus sp. Hm123]|uniref:ABC transporter ATP-binding protein n=1 Tax=Bacillus sp. Hm123 TaxID=3450745 RepID=UPI003F426773